MGIEQRQPTPLIDPSERPAVVVAPLRRPGRWRSLTLVTRWSVWALAEAQAMVIDAGGSAGRGRRLRDLLEELGGLWIKVGQLLSLRVDLFAPEFCRELAQLQDRVQGFPGADARRVLEEELGVPWDRVFASFDLTPVAAASIGQVHRATLRDGSVAAVKVRRPFIEESLARDLSLVRRAFALLFALGVAPFMRWRHMQWELDEILREELDYRREASNMRRLRDAMSGRGMYVPRVHDDLSTTRVLVMEFVSGVLMSDYIAIRQRDPQRVDAWERENNVDPRRLVRRFALSILQQIIEDNLYHGDLHPGNVVLLRDSRVALLDFGTVGTTDREYLDRFSAFMQAMARLEYERAADLALLMTAGLPNVDVAPAREEVIRELTIWGRRTGVPELPYTVKSVDAVNVAITRVFFKHRITFEWTFLRIRRALATMDATGMRLYPDANYTNITQAYFKRAGVRAFQRRIQSALARASDPLMVSGADLERHLRDMTELALQIQRRRLRIATRTLSGAIAILAWGARWARVIAVASATALLVVLIGQHGATWMRAGAVAMSAGLVTQAPAWDWQTWAALVLACAVVARLAGILRTEMLQPDVQSPDL